MKQKPVPVFPENGVVRICHVMGYAESVCIANTGNAAFA